MEKERLHKKSVFGSSFVSVEERERESRFGLLARFGDCRKE